MSEQPIIRRAVAEDIPEILALIKELALFEECPERVSATEDSLFKTLSFPSSPKLPEGKTGYAYTFLLTLPSESASASANGASQSGKDEVVAGFALYFNNYSTWLASPGVFLEDLFVRPQFRRRGYARKLLVRLAQEAYDLNGEDSRLEWNCLKWNKGALDFYESIGGRRLDEWVGIRVDDERLGKLSGARSS